MWHLQTVPHIVRGPVVAGHRGCGCPREVVMQNLPNPIVVSKTGICQCLIETGDRSTVHLLVKAVATVYSHHRGLVAIGGRIRRRPSKCLGPVGGEPLAMLGVKPVTE